MEMKYITEILKMFGVAGSEDAIKIIYALMRLEKRLENELRNDPQLLEVELGKGLLEKGVNINKDSVRYLIDVFLSTEKRINWEEVIGRTDDRYGMHVPEVLVKEFEAHYSAEAKDVLITEAEKFMPYLHHIVESHKEYNFTMTTQNQLMMDLLGMMFDSCENIDVMCTSIYQADFIFKKFDLILSVPTIGIRDMVSEKEEFICREYDLVALENMLLHLNRDGKLLIVLPARITFGTGKIADLRKFIQQMYKIEEITELPEGLFTFSGIKTYLFAFSTGTTDDVIIKRYSSKTRPSKTKPCKEFVHSDETFVMLDELEDMGDWNISKIFAMQDEDWQNYNDSNVKKMELGNVAKVFRGKSVTKKDEFGSIGVINISNIGDFEINYDTLDHMKEEKRKIANYLLEEGDVLLPARGTAIRSAAYQEQSYACIASSNVVVIRPDEKLLLGGYLKIFLDSPMGKKMISSLQQGTTVMNISYKDLSSLEIPVLTIDEQREIVEEYNHELDRYKKSIDAAEKRWSEAKERIQNRLI